MLFRLFRLYLGGGLLGAGQCVVINGKMKGKLRLTFLPNEEEMGGVSLGALIVHFGKKKRGRVRSLFHFIFSQHCRTTDTFVTTTMFQSKSYSHSVKVNLCCVVSQF